MPDIPRLGSQLDVASVHIMSKLMLDLLFKHMFEKPQLGINLHYDDLYSSSVATTKHQVENNIMRAMHDLEQGVHSELKATIAEHKVVVIASDFGLQRALARRLGKFGGKNP